MPRACSSSKARRRSPQREYFTQSSFSLTGNHQAGIASANEADRLSLEFWPEPGNILRDRAPVSGNCGNLTGVTPGDGRGAGTMAMVANRLVRGEALPRNFEKMPKGQFEALCRREDD